MSCIIELVQGSTVEQAAANAGANVRQQAAAREFALHTKAVCLSDRVILQFIVTKLGELKMAATYINGRRMTDRQIVTWSASGAFTKAEPA